MYYLSLRAATQNLSSNFPLNWKKDIVIFCINIHVIISWFMQLSDAKKAGATESGWWAW